MKRGTNRSSIAQDLKKIEAKTLIGQKVSEVEEIIRKQPRKTIKCDYIADVREGVRLARKDNIFFSSKYGYLDSTASKLLIDFQYDSADYFNGGLAAVKKGKKWGYINREGNVVIDFLFDDANSFYWGYAKVSIAYKTFIIDREGTIVKEL